MGKAKSENDESTAHWWMNLKCDPDEAFVLRDLFTAVIPGYHMSKVHWNTVELEKSIPQSLIVELIDHSYNLVVKSLTKKLQAELASL